jgi:hypothetical protein
MFGDVQDELQQSRPAKLPASSQLGESFTSSSLDEIVVSSPHRHAPSGATARGQEVQKGTKDNRGSKESHASSKRREHEGGKRGRGNKNEKKKKKKKRKDSRNKFGRDEGKEKNEERVRSESS